MISKKNLMFALTAIGLTNAALSTGCVVIASDPNQYLEMNASVFDLGGQPLNYPFDYYLNMVLEDGTVDGTLVSFHQDQQHTDYAGNWGLTLSNPELFVDTGTSTCYDSCVSYDAYGCTAYATDCWANTYSAAFDTGSIRSGSVQAFIGIDAITSYVTYASSLNLRSRMTGLHTFTQSDEFDTSVIVLGGASARTQSVGSGSAPRASIQINSEARTSGRGKAISAAPRTSKPTIIKDLSTLTPAQMANLNKVRKAFGVPARTN